MRVGFIYALCHPETGEVRYVGLSIDPKRRLRQHVQAANAGWSRHLHCWIRTLEADPVILILEEAERSELPALEKRYVAALREKGVRLTNLTDGGDGLPNPTPEVRARVSAKMRGRKLSPEAQAKHLAAVRSPEHRARLSAASKGREVTPEWRAKLREAALRQWERATPEMVAQAGAKISAAHTGKKASPEAVAKRAASNRGKKRSLEVRAQMAVAQRLRFQREAGVRANG